MPRDSVLSGRQLRDTTLAGHPLRWHRRPLLRVLPGSQGHRRHPRIQQQPPADDLYRSRPGNARAPRRRHAERPLRRPPLPLPHRRLGRADRPQRIHLRRRPDPEPQRGPPLDRRLRDPPHLRRQRVGPWQRRRARRTGRHPGLLRLQQPERPPAHERRRAGREQRTLRHGSHLEGRRRLAVPFRAHLPAAGGRDRDQGAHLLRDLCHRVHHRQPRPRTGAFHQLRGGSRPGSGQQCQPVADRVQPELPRPHPVHLLPADAGRSQLPQRVSG